MFTIILPNSYSIVDDAYSYILDIAIKYTKSGFKLRDKYKINGTCKPGEKMAVAHNSLFKGNEYWFWVGFNLDFVPKNKIHIKVLDKNKKEIPVEKKQLGEYGNVIGARILAPKTGAYYIVFWVDKDMFIYPDEKKEVVKIQTKSNEPEEIQDEEISENNSNDTNDTAQLEKQEKPSKKYKMPEGGVIQWALTYAQR